MTLYGRRRFIISGSEAPNIKSLIDSKPEWSASFHSTSSCDIPNLVYCDVDIYDKNTIVSVTINSERVCSYLKDDSWVVEGDELKNQVFMSPDDHEAHLKKLFDTNHDNDNE
tara:strand:+ start:348 stop:683 length:336 start_codon:yes stop_codon:yes gene_type:complete